MVEKMHGGSVQRTGSDGLDETCSCVRLQWRCNVLAFSAIVLPSLALAHRSRNTDSEGHFLSGFNDPCDFSWRKRVLGGSSTCLPRP